MLQHTEPAAAEAPFYLLGGVNTVAGIPGDESKLNIPGTLARGLPRLHTIPGWKELKGDVPVALVASGPSVKDTLHEIREFPVVMCAGSTHDWLIEHGHVPTYCVIADPDKVCANYVRKANDETVYLVATHCHPSVFDALEGRKVRIWHLAPCDPEYILKHDKEMLEEGILQAVGGGCTVGLRCLSIAMMLGYKNVHFFGYDSSYAEEKGRSHVYDFSEPGEEAFLGVTYRVSVNYGLNGPSEKTFYCAGYMMAQAQHFKDLLSEYGGCIDPTFHGTGLLPEYGRMYRALRDAAIAEAKAKGLLQ